MKKIYVLLIFYCFALKLTSLEWELQSQFDWGKRFADSFDKFWPNIRKSPFEMTQANQEKYESLRDFLHISLALTFSPFYQHFFGLGFRYFFTPNTVEQSFSIYGNLETWKLNFQGYNPFLTYRFYPIAKEKNFFLSTQLGFILGQMDLELVGNTYSGKAKLSGAEGLSLEIFAGYHFPLQGKTFLFITSGLEIQRVENFTGSAEISGFGSQDIELFRKDNYLLPLNPNTAHFFGIQEKATLWNNQLRFGLGLVYRLGAP